MLIVSHTIATKTITKFNNITYLAKVSYLKIPIIIGVFTVLYIKLNCLIRRY